MKSLKIAFISDIHIDFWIPPTTMGPKLDRKIEQFIDTRLQLPEADVLVFAGDNTHYPLQMQYLLKAIVKRQLYKKILVTYGNHDMYLVSNNQINDFKLSKNKVDFLKQLCNEVDTVEFLDGDIVEVDGVKFGGSIMWYDFTYGYKNFGLTFELMRSHWYEVSNDGHHIVAEDYANVIRDKTEMFFNGYGRRKRMSCTFNPIKFFEREQTKLLKIIDECDVFVSHVAPAVPPNLNPEHNEAGAGFYFFDGVEYLHKPTAPKLWIFGHVHDRYNFVEGNTRLVCNPLGYNDEKLPHTVTTIDLNDLDSFSFK